MDMGTLLQINVEVNFGSTGRIAEDIGKLAMESGWKSYIAYGRKKRNSASTLIPIGNKWDHLFHLLQTRLFDKHGLASKRVTRRFIDQIEQIAPTLIHLHNIHGYYINFELLFDYLKQKGIPVVWTFHDCWPMTGHCTHFEHVACEKWQTTCEKCPQLQVYPSSWGVDRSKKNHLQKKSAFSELQNLTIVTVSNWLRKTVQKSFLSEVRCEVILNGIDTTTFTPTSFKALREKFQIENKFVILGVASVWSSNKGLADFLALAQYLQKDETIVLIGLTKKQIATLPKNILGIERTDSIEELAAWYATSDAYVNTSLEESFGLTTAEALACGTPVVVYNATACPEMVSPEVGFVNPKNDVHTLYKSVQQIKQKGKAFYSTACRERAVSLYAKDENFVKYLDLYTKLIK